MNGLVVLAKGSIELGQISLPPGKIRLYSGETTVASSELRLHIRLEILQRAPVEKLASENNNERHSDDQQIMHGLAPVPSLVRGTGEPWLTA